LCLLFYSLFGAVLGFIKQWTMDVNTEPSNVRSLYKPGSLKRVTELERYRLDLEGVQGVR